MIIKVENTLTEKAQNTDLSFPEASGQAVIRWKNPNGFAASWAVQVGKTGEERAEVGLLGTAAVDGTAGTLTANLTYDHAADTPVYAIKYDQVVFERSITGTSGVAAPMTDGTITIQADSIHTQFDDTSGSPSYAYKAYFRNSVLNTTTTESDWLTSSPSFYSLGKIRERAKRKMLNAKSLTNDQIDDWVNEWLEDMTNTLIDVNEDYALGTTEIGFTGTAQQGTITAVDFKQVRRAWHKTGDTWYRMTKQELTGYNPDETFNETNPFYNMKGDNVIERKPHEVTGTIGLTYYKLNAVLDSDADLLPVAMRGYTRSFVRYCEAQAKKEDNKEQEAERLEAQADMAKERFKSEMTNRNKSGPSYIEIVEGMPNEDIVFW